MELCRDNQASLKGGNFFAYKTFFKGPCERRLDLLARNWHIKSLQRVQCLLFSTVQGWVPFKHLTRVLWIPAHLGSLWLFWWERRSDETNWEFQSLLYLNLKHKVLWVLLCCTLINVIAPLKLAVWHAAKISLINPLLVSLSDRKPPRGLKLALLLFRDQRQIVSSCVILVLYKEDLYQEIPGVNSIEKLF